MSWPEAFNPNETLGADQMLPTVPRDFGERFSLDWAAARAPDRWLRYEIRMQELYEDALDKLRTATGKSLPNPFALPADRSGARIAIGGGLGIATAEAESASQRSKAMKDVTAALDSAREFMPDLPDPREFDGKITAESTEMRKAAQRGALVSYGMGGLGAFLGASAGELSHPAQLATLPLGGTYAAASLARVGLLRFIGRAALTEAGVAAGSQIATEMLDAPYQARLATDGPGSGNEFSDRVDRVLFAAAGGALIGAGLAGLVGAARGVARRLKPTVDEADALKVAERAVYGEQKNPLGPDGVNAHAAALNKAELDVAAGRHADVREIVREEVRRQANAFQNTRGAGQQFHGTSRPIERLDDNAYTTMNIYGQGFYTTDAVDIARGYGNKGSGRQPTLYRVDEAGPVKLFDMEAPLPPEIRARIEKLTDNRTYGDYAEILDGAKTLREFFDEVRANSADFFHSADTVQEFFYSVREALQADGYRGLSHIGGLKTNKEPHRVAIYWHPESDVRIEAADWKAFDILDSNAATRPIADNAPVPPEKPPAGMKEAKADEARALVLAKDFEVQVPSGDGFVKKMASEIMAEADEKVRAAKIAAECAAGGAIG